MSSATKKTNSRTGQPSHAMRRTSSARLLHARAGRSARIIRKRSKRKFFGMPLWEIARGPDPAKGERVGHARAILAVGDVADGLIALGGISRGVIAIGGVSVGVFSLGGVSVGLVAALGGVALAPLALGGVAIGALALGGAGLNIHGRLHAGSVSAGFAACLPGFVRSLRRPQVQQ